MGDARISILEVLKNQILRRTFDCQVPKKGSSNTEERIELLNRFISCSRGLEQIEINFK